MNFLKWLWVIVGRLTYIFVWPLLYFYLRLSGERTRIVVEYKGKILLVQNWLGNGQWLLPGGGVFRNERPTNSAVRELKEETGLIASPRALKLLGNVTYRGKGLKLALVCFRLTLDEKPQLKIRRQLEVMRVKWVNGRQALTTEAITPDTRQVLELWSERSLS